MEKEQNKPQIAVQIMLDESGSMRIFRQITIEAMNKFFAELATSIMPLTVSLSTFTHVQYVKIENVAIYDLPQLDEKSYRPNGGTDIDEAVSHGLSRLHDTRAELRVLVMVTDGTDPPNCRATPEAIRAFRGSGGMVLWLGIGEYAADCGKRCAVPKSMVLNYEGHKAEAAMKIAAKLVLEFTGRGTADDIGFSEKDRKAVC